MTNFEQITNLQEGKIQIEQTLRSVFATISIEERDALKTIQNEIIDDIQTVKHQSTRDALTSALGEVASALARYVRRELIFLEDGGVDFTEHELTDEEIQNTDLFLPKLIEDALKVADITYANLQAQQATLAEQLNTPATQTTEADANGERKVDVIDNDREPEPESAATADEDNDIPTRPEVSE